MLYFEIRERICHYKREPERYITLITRPGRFGKTLNMSMQEKFFSVKYAGRDDLLERNQLNEKEKAFYQKVSAEMSGSVAAV